MPRPFPQTFSCPRCGWQCTTLPGSDDLLSGVDWLTHCGACRHTDLEHRPASKAEIMQARLHEFFRTAKSARHRLSSRCRIFPPVV